MDRDITDSVDFDLNDDEYLSLRKCVCGKQFDYWEFSISIYRDSAKECPSCGRRLYFLPRIAVYCITDENEYPRGAYG